MSESKLLKLKTDLKSLKFEPNNEPYIQFPIGYTKSFEKNDAIPQSISDFYLSNRTNPDFPLRGGTIDLDLRTQTTTKASQIDRERIKRFLNDKSKGPLFIKKQVGLQLSNPKIETEGIIPGALVGLENTRFYNNGINTLAQVGVQGTGVHGLRHGAVPFGILQKAYYDVVNLQNINNNSEENRLYLLKQTKLSNSNTQSSEVISRLGISSNRSTLFQYLGGPDSTYGIGLTTIKRYTDTEQGTTLGTLAVGFGAQKYAKIYRTYQQIDTVSDELSTKKKGFPISERSNIYGVGDPGNPSSVKDIKKDRLNLNTLLYYDASAAPWEIESVYSKDIIKFVFEAIDNDQIENSTAVFFRAMLSGITDNHQASINGFKYLGRGEEFYTYQGAVRTIGFSFKIAPQSAEEQKPLYKKLNYLISQVYPDYSTKTGIMRAPLMKITIGDYFYRLPGLLESVNITIDDNVPWEVYSNTNLKQLPHVISVQCQFKPIQDFLPRRESYNKDNPNTNSPFLVDDNSDYIKINVKGDISYGDAINEQLRKEAEERKREEEERAENEEIRRTTEEVLGNTPIPMIRNS